MAVLLSIDLVHYFYALYNITSRKEEEPVKFVRSEDINILFSNLSSRFSKFEISQIVISCSEKDLQRRNRILILAKKHFKNAPTEIIPPRTGTYTYWLYKKNLTFEIGKVVYIVRIKQDHESKNITYNAAAFTLNHGCMVYFKYINSMENKTDFINELKEQLKVYNNCYLIYNYAEKDCEKYVKEISYTIGWKYLDFFQTNDKDGVRGGLIIAKSIIFKSSMPHFYPVRELADFGVRVKKKTRTLNNN